MRKLLRFLVFLPFMLVGCEEREDSIPISPSGHIVGEGHGSITEYHDAEHHVRCYIYVADKANREQIKLDDARARLDDLASREQLGSPGSQGALFVAGRELGFIHGFTVVAEKEFSDLADRLNMTFQEKNVLWMALAQAAQFKRDTTEFGPSKDEFLRNKAAVLPGKAQNTNIRIERIEVSADDPDRFLTGFTNAVDRAVRNPTRARSTMTRGF